jgi:phosphatidylglycerol lysyltransferase
MEAKSAEEKRFSLGYFNPDYLAHFPIAVVERGDHLLAFANLWMSGEKSEISPDLMRYLPESPNGIMDYLFTQLMLWAKAEGYQTFCLGMAPLAGLENRSLSPLWNRLGGFLYHHGEHFYHFKGLRQYKDKFQPDWEAKYIACPGGIYLPRILTHVASLIGGGIKGVLTQ